MLNLLMLALPTSFKGKLPVIGKYLGYGAIGLLLVGLVYFVVSTMNTNMANVKHQREQEIAQKAAVIATQQNTIEQQKQELEQIKQSIEQLKQSHEKTLATVNELKQEQKKIQITVTKKKQVIEKQLKQIDTLDIPEEDKDAQKSLVLIKGLNETYCELFKDSCNPGVN